MSKSFPIVEKKPAGSIPLELLQAASFKTWIKTQDNFTKNWVAANGFTATPEAYCLLPTKDGKLGKVLFGTLQDIHTWSVASLPGQLPEGTYHIEGKITSKQATQVALGWALATYQFTRYKKDKKQFAALVAPKGCDTGYVRSMSDAIFWTRDLINTPANDMNPKALATEAANWAKAHKGQVSVISGEALLKQNYPMVYTVGKAADIPPHLVDIRFPRKGAPKVTLVGKGVCFDSGGLDIKNTSGMRLMKKDMGGAANVLALAKTIIDSKLPVQLRVLLPIVENAISGNAMRPLDIVKTRKGITVEIGNTDAEGRLILCDALYEADGETPDLLIDCATLTGAARVALGTDVPAFFTNDDKLAAALTLHANNEHDPLWRLPLHTPYRKQMDSSAADLSNDSSSGYGGAITAALYLQEFVSKTPSWLHIDMMAWNQGSKPGRPQGGEAMAIRALYALIKERYGKHS